MSGWDAWVGRTETRRDRVGEARLAQWLATFDRDAPADGTAPQGFHWCLCTPDEPTARLGDDGHPLRDGGEVGLLPPVPLPRRMWASSDIDFFRPLRVGDLVERRSRIVGITSKLGSSGELVFVDVQHEVNTEALALRERQSIVYRSPPSLGLAPAERSDPASLPDAKIVRTIRPSEALLFRYSALTFNSHRIHYDRPYATEQEGYAGLVVQGPLTATLLLDLARRELGEHALRSFSFRGVSPAMVGEELTLSLSVRGRSAAMNAVGPDGRSVMTAHAGLPSTP